MLDLAVVVRGCCGGDRVAVRSGEEKRWSDRRLQLSLLLSPIAEMGEVADGVDAEERTDRWRVRCAGGARPPL